MWPIPSILLTLYELSFSIFFLQLPGCSDENHLNPSQLTTGMWSCCWTVCMGYCSWHKACLSIEAFFFNNKYMHTSWQTKKAIKMCSSYQKCLSKRSNNMPATSKHQLLENREWNRLTMGRQLQRENLFCSAQSKMVVSGTLALFQWTCHGC